MPLEPKTPRNSRKQKTPTSPTAAASQTANPSTSLATSEAVRPVDMSQVAHGLSYPEFDVNGSLATDLFGDTAGLPQMDKVDADLAVDRIEKKKQALRVAQSNIGLNQEVVRTGVAQEKFVGSVIDYATTKINNQTKFVGYQTAGVNLQSAQVKHSQAQEKLTQEQMALEGLQALTPLVREEWEQKKILKESKIQDLRAAVFIANSKLEATLAQTVDLNQVANSVD